MIAQTYMQIRIMQNYGAKIMQFVIKNKFFYIFLYYILKKINKFVYLTLFSGNKPLVIIISTLIVRQTQVFLAALRLLVNQEIEDNGLT